MKSKQFLRVGIFVFFSQIVLTSEGTNNNWKVMFFNGYMNGYASVEDPGHEAISQVLQSSFDRAALVAPEHEQHLVKGVQDQVAYFVGLQDEEEKERELGKCKEGMKQASSFWAKMAPEAVKAKFFVDRFVEESSKRPK